MTYDFQKLNGFDFRDSALTVTNFRPTKTQSGDKPKIMRKYWEELRLGEGKEMILLLAGEYLSLVNGKTKEWKEYLLHKTPFIKGQQQFEIVCSAGCSEHGKQPCVGCVYYENGAKKDNPWYPKPTVKFNIISLAQYHDNIPYVTKDGQSKTREDGKAFVVKQKCIGKGCTYCPNYGKPTVFGRHMKMELTGTHFTQLMNYNKKTLNNLCSGCGKTIVINEYSCTQCDKQLLDVANGNFTLDYLERYSKTIQTCESCNYSGLPKEGLDCGYDADGTIKEVENCPFDYPIRMNIFNTVLYLHKEGEKSKSALFFDDKKSVSPNSLIKYSSPTKQALPDIVDIAITATGGKLFNLDAEIQIIPLDEQAKTLKGENPYANLESLPSALPISQIPGTVPFPINFPQS